MCKVGEVVVVGGVRRSALISLSNLNDDQMRHAKSGVWWDEPEKNIYPMPINASNKDEVFVGRIRKSPNNDREINLWLSCDNLLKGAALNALQILESMIKRDLIKIN